MDTDIVTYIVSYTARQVPKLYYLIYRFILNDLAPDDSYRALRSMVQSQKATLYLLTTTQGHVLLLKVHYGLYRVRSRTALYKAAKAFFYQHNHHDIVPPGIDIIKSGRDRTF